MTVEDLKRLGANTEEGLARCLNNEQFYLRLAEKALRDDAMFEKLGTALDQGDLTVGFEAAHALKGVLANLSLTPLLDPVSEITELLRAGTRGDCDRLYAKIVEERGKFLALC